MSIKGRVWEVGGTEEYGEDVSANASDCDTDESSALDLAEQYCAESISESALDEDDFPKLLMVRVRGKEPVKVEVRAFFEPTLIGRIMA